MNDDAAQSSPQRLLFTLSDHDITLVATAAQPAAPAPPNQPAAATVGPKKKTKEPAEAQAGRVITLMAFNRRTGYEFEKRLSHPEIVSGRFFTSDDCLPALKTVEGFMGFLGDALRAAGDEAASKVLTCHGHEDDKSTAFTLTATVNFGSGYLSHTYEATIVAPMSKSSTSTNT